MAIKEKVKTPALVERNKLLRMTKLIASFIGTLVLINCQSQELNIDEFKKLQTSKHSLYWDNNSNSYFGCGLNLDCIPLPVIFKKVTFNPKQKELQIEGYVNPRINDNNDTIGLNIYNIFTAVPKNQKLKKIHTLLRVGIGLKDMDDSCSVNLKTGYFFLKFSFSEKTRLYIESGELYNMNEYDIGSLLAH